MQPRNPYSHWLSHTFQSGDQVIVDGREHGTVENVFPDGIHMVKLDNVDKIIAVTVDHLTRLDIQRKPDRTSRLVKPLES